MTLKNISIQFNKITIKCPECNTKSNSPIKTVTIEIDNNPICKIYSCGCIANFMKD